MKVVFFYLSFCELQRRSQSCSFRARQISFDVECGFQLKYLEDTSNSSSHSGCCDPDFIVLTWDLLKTVLVFFLRVFCFPSPLWFWSVLFPSSSSGPLRTVSSSELWPMESLLRSRETLTICLALESEAAAEATAAAAAAARKCGCKRLAAEFGDPE